MALKIVKTPYSLRKKKSDMNKGCEEKKEKTRLRDLKYKCALSAFKDSLSIDYDKEYEEWKAEHPTSLLTKEDIRWIHANVYDDPTVEVDDYK